MLMLSLLTLKETLRSLSDKLQLVLDSLYDIRESDTLVRILACILRLGNFLNQGTARGCSFGFDLSILPKLIDTKSSLPNYNLFNYVAQTVSRKDEEEANKKHPKKAKNDENEEPLTYIEKLRYEMTNVMMSKKIDLKSIQEACKESVKQFQKL